MPLTPEEIRSKRFRTVSRRGYDRGEVSGFLEQVAEDYSATVRKIEVAESAHDSADDIAAEVADVLRAARESAQRIREKAQEAADSLFAAVEQRANELRAKAERLHSESRAQADEKARRIVENAELKSRELGERAERERAELLDRAEERHATLMGLEQQLHERLAMMESLVGEMWTHFEPVEEATSRPHKEEARDQPRRSADEERDEAKAGATVVPEPSTPVVEADGRFKPEPSKGTSSNPS
jgi:DivIVA domain-containing protein